MPAGLSLTFRLVYRRPPHVATVRMLMLHGLVAKLVVGA